MPKIFNEENLIYTENNSPIPEFAWHTSQKLADMIGSDHMYFDVRSLDPDSFSYPYHFHVNAEEMIVVLSGEATVRTLDGFSKIKTGDIMFFEKGASGAHQVYNHKDKPCKYLDIRTKTDLDVCEYPDTGKMLLIPKTNAKLFMKGKPISYFEGEENVRDKWMDK